MHIGNKHNLMPILSIVNNLLYCFVFEIDKVVDESLDVVVFVFQYLSIIFSEAYTLNKKQGNKY